MLYLAGLGSAGSVICAGPWGRILLVLSPLPLQRLVLHQLILLPALFDIDADKCVEFKGIFSGETPSKRNPHARGWFISAGSMAFTLLFPPSAAGELVLNVGVSSVCTFRPSLNGDQPSIS